MENVRVKVIHHTCWNNYEFGVFEGRKSLMMPSKYQHWQQEKTAVKHAKAMAKRIGIPYDPEIIKQHGFGALAIK